MKPSTSSKETDGVQSDIATMITEIECQIIKILGLSASVSAMATLLPNTALESANVFCPEIAFPAMAGMISAHGDQMLFMIENLNSLMRTHMKDAA